MRIIFFTHYFPPEGNAPATRTYDHCVRWAGAGHQVTVITGVPNVPNGVVYPGYRNRLWPQRETIDGVDVIRVWTYVAANAGGMKRILNFLTYMCSAVLAFTFLCRRPQVIVATSPQFFCGWAGILASWIKWAPFVLEIRDIWPESIVTVGAMKRGFATRFLEQMERWMYRSANHIVAVGDGYRDAVLSKVDVGNRISVVTNGVDLDQYQVQGKSTSFLARYDLADRFVCSYVGTIGMAHGLETVLDAADILRQQKRNDILFCLIGDGAERENLQRQCNERGLQHWVHFTGRLDKADIPLALASSDALLVHLKKCDLFETVIPSKIFEAMAMQRPLIMGVKGPAADIVRQASAGIEMEPSDPHDLVRAVCVLADDEEFYHRLSHPGREFVGQHFSRDALAQRMLRILEKVANRGAVTDEEPPAADQNSLAIDQQTPQHVSTHD